MKMKPILKLFFVVCLLAMPAMAAGNNTIELKDLMGNPMDMLKPMLSEVKWLFGSVYGWTFLVVLICIAIAILKAAYGSITSNAATKAEGKSAAIEIVAIVFIGVVATAVVVFLFNTFIFK